ncbi:MAG: hypothetical protein ACRCX2_19455 [Paraclostridium sp.]
MGLIEKGLICPKCNEKTLKVEINSFSVEEYCSNCDHGLTTASCYQID